MQHKSIYFPIRQSGYVGKCMNYFNSLNCPETSLRASERGGRGWAVLSVCSRDRNHSYSINCPEIWEMGVPTRCSDGGKQWYPSMVSSEQDQSRGLGAILLQSSVPWLELLHALQDSFFPGWDTAS